MYTISQGGEPVFWDEGGQRHESWWWSDAGKKLPKAFKAADDTLSADDFHAMASTGTGVIWRGDYHQARQVLQGVARRFDKSVRKSNPGGQLSLVERFHRYRMAQAQRAQLLGMLLLPFELEYHLPLRRAPALRDACEQAFGPLERPALISLREVLGAIGAYEWRRKGVPVAALDGSIHPHYGVFSPIRGEYLDLVASAPLGGAALAFDIGVGTGVLSAILVRRGVARVVATDIDERALNCAAENLAHFGFDRQVDLRKTHLFPEGQADLVVCNPPWLPGKATTSLEHAVYDPDSQMLKGFLSSVANHLSASGEGWLIMSDLAERIGLRKSQELEGWISAGGLRVIDRIDTRPRHARASDSDDPLFEARSKEVTSLWRLGRN